MDTKISIIIPVYNMGRYLKQCLDSILIQSIISNIQVIAVDDGSSDDSLSILLEYKNKLDITIIVQHNMGAGAARNQGLMIAKGEYIAFMDPDDYYPNATCLEELYKAAKINQVSVCGGIIVQDVYGTISPIRASEQRKMFVNRFVDLRECDDTYFFHRFIYKTSMLKRKNIRFPKYRRVEDQHFLLNALIAGGGFYALNIESYVYRCGYKSVEWTISLFLEVLDSYYVLVSTAKKNDLKKMIHGRLGLFNEEHSIPLCKYFNDDEVIKKVKRINGVIRNWLGENSLGIRIDERNEIVDDAFNEIKRIEKILESDKKTILYGAGVNTYRFIEGMGCSKYKIEGIAVSSKTEGSNNMKEYPIRLLEEYDKNDSEIQFLITTNKTAQEEIKKYIRKKGFKNSVYSVDIRKIELALAMR